MRLMAHKTIRVLYRFDGMAMHGIYSPRQAEPYVWYAEEHIRPDVFRPIVGKCLVARNKYTSYK